MKMRRSTAQEQQGSTAYTQRAGSSIINSLMYHV
jgi:hypothetical protein